MRPSEHLLQRPLRERLELALRLHDRDDLAAGKQIDSAGKTAALATCALRKPTQDAIPAAEHADSLGGLGPVPLPDAKSGIDDVRHAGIVTAWGRNGGRNPTQSREVREELHAASGGVSVATRLRPPRFAA